MRDERGNEGIENRFENKREKNMRIFVDLKLFFFRLLCGGLDSISMHVTMY